MPSAARGQSIESEAASTLAGLLAVGFSLLSFLFLRWIGGRHLKAPPDLGETIQRMERTGHDDPDYYI